MNNFSLIRYFLSHYCLTVTLLFLALEWRCCWSQIRLPPSMSTISVGCPITCLVGRSIGWFIGWLIAWCIQGQKMVIINPSKYIHIEFLIMLIKKSRLFFLQKINLIAWLKQCTENSYFLWRLFDNTMNYSKFFLILFLVVIFKCIFVFLFFNQIISSSSFSTSCVVFCHYIHVNCSLLSLFPRQFKFYIIFQKYFRSHISTIRS